MQRSLYPDQVEVVAQTLANTEASKIAEILLRSVNLGSAGVVSGLVVSVSAVNNTTVDVSAGTAFAPNGEALVSARGATSLALPDYTLDGYNFICAVYGEVEGSPQAHAVDGTTKNTDVVTGATIKAFSRAGLLNLATSSTNLAVDAVDRLTILAVVQANGTGVPLNTPLRVTNAPTVQRWATSSQPTNITGVTITRYSPVMPASFAITKVGGLNPSLQLVYTVGTGLITLRAPGDTVAGLGVNITGGGNFTLGSDGSTHTASVSVVAAALPQTGGPFTDNLTITSIYEPDAPMGFARDELHRTMMGTGLPGVTNPHGLAFQDIVGQSLTIPQTLTLGSGLLATAAQGLVPRLTTALNSFSARTLLWSIPITGTVPLRYFRVYAQSGALEFTYNASWNETAVEWAKDDTAAVANRLSITSVGISAYGRAAALAANWVDASWSGTFGSTEGAGNAQFYSFGQIIAGTLNLATSAGVATPRFRADYGTSFTRTLISYSEASTSPSGTAIRVYRATAGYSGSASVIERVHNATWDNATALWTQDNAAQPSLKEEFSRAGISVLQRVAGAAPWADTLAGWVDLLWEVYSGGVYIGGGLQVDGVSQSNSYLIDPAQTHSSWVGSPEFTFDITGTPYSRSIPNADPESALSYTLDRASGSTGIGTTAALHLPDGAIITAARLHFLSSNVTGSIRAAIVRAPHTGTGSPESLRAGTSFDSIVTTSATPFTSALTIDETAAIRTVDNTAYFYYVWIDASNTADVFSLRGAEVDYTIDEVTPA